jgi:hypothetical protein
MRVPKMEWPLTDYMAALRMNITADVARARGSRVDTSVHAGAQSHRRAARRSRRPLAEALRLPRPWLAESRPWPGSLRVVQDDNDGD